MTHSTLHPRPNHISELSRGLQLPLPEVGEDLLEIIAEGILKAFNDIRIQHPKVISNGSEAEVTDLLETRLNALIQEDPFLGMLLLNVVRGKETLNFDGSNLEKRPDLSLFLTRRTYSFPLIMEAKILDVATGKTENLYCKNGVLRFIVGEYAWGNREAFMLGYVRDSSSIGNRLTPFLSKKMLQTPPEYMIEELPNLPTGSTGSLARSKHGRTFTYIHQDAPNNLPGSIALWHLWLS